MYEREFSYSRRWLAIVFVVLTVTLAAQPAAATQRPPAQNMCADCDLLKEQLRIVIERVKCSTMVCSCFGGRVAIWKPIEASPAAWRPRTRPCRD